MSWVDSIKEFAKQNGGKFAIPKRGTEEYEKVRSIQQSLVKKASEPVVEEKPKRKPRAPKTENPPTEKKGRVVPPPENPKPAPVVGEKVANPPKEKAVRVVEPPAEKKPRKKRSEVEAEKKQGRARKMPAKTTVQNETVVMEFK
jgi:hypothetical protein